MLHDDYVDKIIVLFNQSELHSVLTDIMPSEFMVEFHKLLDFLNGPEYEAKKILEGYRLQNNIYSESDWLKHYVNLSKLSNSTNDIDVARVVKSNFLYLPECLDMGPKESKVIQLLKDAGATKAYISEGFDFEAETPDGKIIVDEGNNETFLKIYKMYTTDPDGIVDEDQSLGIMSVPNYPKWNRKL